MTRHWREEETPCAMEAGRGSSHTGEQRQKEGTEISDPGSGQWEDWHGERRIKRVERETRWRRGITPCAVENVAEGTHGFCALEGLTGCRKTKHFRRGGESGKASSGT